jgi:hypothetical protein
VLLPPDTSCKSNVRISSSFSLLTHKVFPVLAILLYIELPNKDVKKFDMMVEKVEQEVKMLQDNQYSNVLIA